MGNFKEKPHVKADMHTMLFPCQSAVDFPRSRDLKAQQRSHTRTVRHRFPPAGTKLVHLNESCHHLWNN